jgi:tRNA(fMet)-specific endonuclease VapC
MVILDANIIIDHLRMPRAESHYKQIVTASALEELKISTITIQELYSGKSTREEWREFEMLDSLKEIELVPYNYEIAQCAGILIRDSANKLTFPDAAIAATAILNKAKLFTLNVKYFKEIKGLQLWEKE